METAIDEVNPMRIILDIMISVQSNEMSGKQKKSMVLHQLRQVLDKETFDRYGPVFEMTIDLLKFISHDKTMLNGLKSLKTGWLSCIS
jgi:hypothetical protein